MLTIQELGLSIFSDNPKSFYVLGGAEHGIKERYIDELAKKFNIPKKEMPTVNDAINLFRTKHLVPLQPCVYVVRYDEQFVSGVSESVASVIKNLNISGFVVCIYSEEKHISKINKYLPDNTASVDKVDKQFVMKYLIADYPTVPQHLISAVIDIAYDYGHAQQLTYDLSLLSSHWLDTITTAEVADLFGYNNFSLERHIQIGVASRSFKYLLNSIERYQDESDRILYCILQTMIELDKLLDNPRADSLLKQYIKLWTREDVYYMFMHTYQALVDNRSGSISDLSTVLIYLASLLQYTRIPDTEVLHDGV